MFRTSKKITIGVADGGDPSDTRFITTSAYAPNKDTVGGASTTAAIGFSRATLEELKPMSELRSSVLKARPDVETAGNGVNNLPSGTQVTEIVSSQLMTDVFDGFISTLTTDGVCVPLNRVYADMYYHDSICGSAVDLMSLLPFSDFSLVGLRDTKILQRYQESLDKINIQPLLPSLSIDYLVVGAFLASLTWDDNKKIFNGITPHSMDCAKLTQVPLYGVDPLIDITIPQNIAKLLADVQKNEDPRIKDILERLPAEYRGAINGGAKSTNGRNSAHTVQLQPNSTIFIPRRAMLNDFGGVSMFRRALPAWMIEKALIRGTLDQVYKRQRAALHITVGNGQDWVASPQQMQEIANMFMHIDLDPVGALVVTRDGVNVNEVRRGDDFWKWSTEYDSLSTIKFRALGISESFITGDANYNTMDKTLSVMLENIKNYRALVTRELFYTKIFPAISQENGVLRNRFATLEVAASGEGVIRPDNLPDNWKYDVEKEYYSAEIAAAPNVSNFDSTKYAMPVVQWHKQLLPEADDAYLALLTQLEEKGVPIPLRILAAAGGLKLEQVFESMSSDVEDRKRLKAYVDKISQFKTQPEPTDDEGGGEGENASDLFATIGRSSVMRRGIGAKRNEIADHLVHVHRHEDGKPKATSVKGTKVLTERLHKVVAAAATENARRENAKLKRNGYKSNKSYHSVKVPKEED